MISCKRNSTRNDRNNRHESSEIWLWRRELRNYKACLSDFRERKRGLTMDFGERDLNSERTAQQIVRTQKLSRNQSETDKKKRGATKKKKTCVSAWIKTTFIVWPSPLSQYLFFFNFTLIAQKNCLPLSLYLNMKLIPCKFILHDLIKKFSS